MYPFRHFHLIFLLTIGCLLLLNSFATADNQRLASVRDSLNKQLARETQPHQRLLTLLNLSDVDLSLSDDYSHVEQMWREAIAAGEDKMAIGAGKSLTLRWINGGKLDSADVWIARCKQNFRGPGAEGALAYLQMMREVRDLEKIDHMAKRLVKEQVHLHDGKHPFDDMRMLFELGILASQEKYSNSQLNGKSSREYLEEGLALARSLPIIDGYSFHLQFLVALGYDDPKYAEEMIQLRDDYLKTQGYDRPFRSRRADIMSYARMLNNCETIGRQKADECFAHFRQLTTQYPYDAPMPLDFYYYKVAVNYYLYIKDYRTALMCCDSARINAPKCNAYGNQFYKQSMICREALGDYHGAFKDACLLMHVKDSLAAKSAADNLMELQTQYGVDRLTFENRIKKIQLWSALMLCTALAILLVLAIRHTRTLRRKNRALYEQINGKVRTFKQLQQIKMEVTERPDIVAATEPTLFNRFEELLSRHEIYADPELNREKVAALLSTNTTYLSQAIQEGCGESFGEYLTNLRMNHAITLMQEDTRTPLEEIGLMAGYSSYGGFYAAFRKQFNLSPRKYIDFLNKEKRESGREA